MSTYNIGIDLGGTKIEIAVLDKDRNVVLRQRDWTEAHHGAEGILSRIHTLYKLALIEIGHAPHTLGVGTPGAISPLTGLLKNSNTQCLNGTDLKANLERLLEHTVVIENDANCFALAEAVMGAAEGYQTVFGVILGTGCGGGIVIDGQILVGAQRIAGEWGHTVLDPNGVRCPCGRRGCVEAYISGTGLENQNLLETGVRLPARKIFIDPGSREVVEQFYRNFGQALANVINILDPNCVVLGGGLSNQPGLYTEGVVETYKRIYTDRPTTPIIANQLGDSAGVFGAALLGANYDN